MLDTVEGALVASYLAKGGRIVVCPTLKTRAITRYPSANRRKNLDAYDADDGQAHTETQKRVEARALGIVDDERGAGISIDRLRPITRRSAVYHCAHLALPRYVWRGVLNHIASRNVALGFALRFGA